MRLLNGVTGSPGLQDCLHFSQEARLLARVYSLRACDNDILREGVLARFGTLTERLNASASGDTSQQAMIIWDGSPTFLPIVITDGGFSEPEPYRG